MPRAPKNTTLDERTEACARVRAGESIEVVAASYAVKPPTVRSWLLTTPRELACRERHATKQLWIELAKWVDPAVHHLISKPKELLNLCALLENRIAEARTAVAATERGVVAEGVVSLADYRARRFGERTDGGAA